MMNSSSVMNSDALLLREPQRPGWRRKAGHIAQAVREASGDLCWPTPQYKDPVSDPVFLFILTPPYSGSTALAQVLNSSPGAVFLQERGEGQWLVPGMCSPNRWQPDAFINWDSVKKVWWSRISFLEQLTGVIDLVIEKSPANLVRAGDLLEQFPRHQVVGFNRNPYANCSSVLYRHSNPDVLPPEERTAMMKRLASFWVFRAAWMQRNIQEFDAVSFTYEQFCGNPESAIAQIKNQVPELTGVDVNKKIQVKDYSMQPLSDQNERQIGKLRTSDLEVISGVLKPHEPLLNYFGYTSNWQEKIRLGGAS